MTEFYLTWTARHGDTERYRLEAPEIVVGRMSDCDLVLSSPFVSRHHAKLLGGPQGYSIVDLNSTGGTSVNGQSVREQKLQPMDRIRLGQSGVELCYVEEKGNQGEARPCGTNLLISVLTPELYFLSCKCLPV